MARRPAPVPKYSKHPTRPTARTWAAGRWVYLGAYNSPDSLAAYRRVCEQVAAGAAAPPRPASPSVNELLIAFWAHAQEHYRRPDGTPTTEVESYKYALRVVRELYGTSPAAAFGPLKLQAVRAAMVKKGWCRSRVNNQVRRVRRVWKWAAGQELVPGALVADLACVAGLRRNRSAARETEDKRPVPDADYAATLPHLVPTVRAMAELQRRCGLRPGEVRLLTPGDLDRTGDLWYFRPAEHKMSHLGRAKEIPLPPAARAVLEPWLAGRGPAELVFTPGRATAEMYAARRAKRRSKVQPSQLDRAKPPSARTRKTADRFSVAGYASWVARAAARAGVEPWSPGRIRHTFGTEVRSKFGLEAAQVLLGHKRADVTQVYAEAARAKAEAAARAMG